MSLKIDDGFYLVTAKQQ